MGCLLLNVFQFILFFIGFEQITHVYVLLWAVRLIVDRPFVLFLAKCL